MDGQQPKQPPIITRSYKGRGASYFFDIRKTKNDRPYLSVTASRRQANSEKAERQTIFIFSEDILGFLEKLVEVKTEIEANEELKSIIG